MSKKIIFADPPAREENYDTRYPNLGILSIIAYCREIYPNFQYYYLESNHNLKTHTKKIKEINPDLYVVSFTSLTSELAYKTIDLVKKEFPSLPIICGGPHSSINPSEILNKSRSDICVIGEGEVTFSEILNYYFNKKKSLKNIKGIAFKKNNKVIINPLRPLIKNLDNLPFPAWDLINFKDYLGTTQIKKKLNTCIVPSRGCPYHCVFCSNPTWKLSKPYLRFRSPKNIAEEVKFLYSKGIREIYIRSDEFNFSLKWAIDVCKEIKKLNFKDLYFQCNLRANNVSEELIKNLKDINCWLVHLGIESGNQRVLDGIKKRITTKDVINVCKLLKKHRIKVYGFFMMYNVWEKNGKLYYETPKEVNNTLRFAFKLFSKKFISYMSWSFATPQPGSELYEIAKKYRLIKENTKLNSMWKIGMKLPNISKKEMLKSRMEGMLLQIYFNLFAGKYNLNQLINLKTKLRFIFRSLINKD